MTLPLGNFARLPSTWRSARLSGLLLACLANAASAEIPNGIEFQVNSYTTGIQIYPDVASDANGDFVVVWNGSQDSGLGVFGQRFRASGSPRGTEFRVNSFTTFAQFSSDVASDSIGNFVVVWQSGAQDGSGFGVFGQRYDASGTPQGSEFRVNTFPGGDQQNPAVASDPDGNFLVVWESGVGLQKGVFGQRYDASGVPQGIEFQVDSPGASAARRYPAVAADANGNFVVVWANSYGYDNRILGRRFSAAGAAQGSEFQVNSFATRYTRTPAVAADASGNFVVVWQSTLDYTSYFTDIFARRFSAAGAPLEGEEFRVNSYTNYSQLRPAVASDERGDFLVVWTSAPFGYIVGRRYDPSGIPHGSDFRVNSGTDQGTLPAVSSSPDGDFVVTWSSYPGDGDSFGVAGQRFGDLIFQDGFEAGDLTRWSSAVDDTASLFVEDETPNEEGRYRVRFYFDPAGFDPGEASNHFRVRIFVAFDGSGRRAITLVLRRLGGAYSLRARVRLDDGTRAETAFLPITDEPHVFELDWQQASAPGADDGRFSLQIDELVNTELSSLDNDESSIDSARLGALSVKTGAAGTLFFDQFESRRQRFIGAE